MKSLTPPDSLHLQAAQGWCELHAFIEADAELDNISASLRSQSSACQGEWRGYTAIRFRRRYETKRVSVDWSGCRRTGGIFWFPLDYPPGLLRTRAVRGFFGRGCQPNSKQIDCPVHRLRAVGPGAWCSSRVAVCAIHQGREPWLFHYPHPPTRANHAH